MELTPAKDHVLVGGSDSLKSETILSLIQVNSDGEKQICSKNISSNCVEGK
jgi:hypothetical protein